MVSTKISGLLSQQGSRPRGQGQGQGPPRIGLHAAAGPEYVVGTWAAWMSGCIVVPLATSHPAKELSYVFTDAGLAMVGSSWQAGRRLAWQ